MRRCGNKSSAGTAGGVNVAERSRTWKSIINNFGAALETIQKKTSFHCVPVAMERCTFHEGDLPLLSPVEGVVDAGQP
jgi:hypothetical protein